jgi:subtilisin family serine protease
VATTKSISEAESLRADIVREIAKHPDAKGLGGAVLAKRNFVAATVPVALLDSLRTDARVAFIQLAESLKYRLPRPEPSTAGERKPKARAVGKIADHKGGADAIIGIIDVGGFDFSHPDFSDGAGGTRFIRIWDQGGDFRPAPKGFDRGSEFTKAHLDAAMKAAPGKRLPATAIEPQSQQTEGSHGTHVASIAAGESGVCPKAMIAAVLIDIPRQQDSVAERRTTFSDSNMIIQAVEYLLDVARAENKPISINISLGTNGGAHDASSGVSRWLDAALAPEGRSICVAAGNAGQEAGETDDDMGWIMGRIHASGQIASAGLTADLEWTVVGNSIVDVSENELEIWYGAQDRFSVQVRPPGADRWIEVKPREFVENRRLPSGTFLSIYNELYHPVNGCNYIAIYLSPDLDRQNPKGIQAGVWVVRLRAEEVRNGRFHCWIERDDPYEFDRVGHRRVSRFPSFFSERSNVDSHSISSLACGHRVIAVANLDTKRQRVNKTSSQGPTRDDRMKPDIAAPGTGIRAAKGFSSDGSSWVEMSGTSMASPYVAGVIGLMLSVNRSLTAAQCSGILQRTARPLPGMDYTWRNDAGFGQIDPEAAIREAGSFNIRTNLD